MAVDMKRVLVGTVGLVGGFAMSYVVVNALTDSPHYEKVCSPHNNPYYYFIDGAAAIVCAGIASCMASSGNYARTRAHSDPSRRLLDEQAADLLATPSPTYPNRPSAPSFDI